MIAFVLAALLDTLPAETPADATFTAAREARSRSAYAHYTVYATVVRYTLAGRPLTRTWDTIEDMRRRLVHSHSLSREDAANPHVPHGINFAAGLTGLSSGSSAAPGAPATGGGSLLSTTLNPETPDDPVGEVTFAIDQDYGLALDAVAIATTSDLSEVSSAAPVLQHIGRTGTIVRNYEVTDLGDVTASDGSVQHHLGLRPLRDPGRYRLRELWIDATTNLPVRAVVHGISNAAPLDTIDWRVDFTQIQGGTYVTRETALAPLRTVYGEVDDATVSFEEVDPTNRLGPTQLVGLADVGIRDP